MPRRTSNCTPSENIDGGAQSPPAGFTFAAYGEIRTATMTANDEYTGYSATRT